MIPRGIIRMASLVFLEKIRQNFVSQIHNLQGTRKRFLITLYHLHMLKKALIFLQRLLDPPIDRASEKMN